MQTYLLKLPNIIPPSYNQHLNIIWHLHQFKLTKEARDFKDNVKKNMIPWKREPDEKPLDKCYFKFTYQVCQDWYRKNENLKDEDISNKCKLLEDAVFEKLGIKDNRVIYMVGEKLQSKIEVYTSIIIESMGEWG